MTMCRNGCGKRTNCTVDTAYENSCGARIPSEYTHSVNHNDWKEEGDFFSEMTFTSCTFPPVQYMSNPYVGEYRIEKE